jgi:hypothetical protein
MHNHPIYLLEPVFHFLDHMIVEYGDVLYMLLVYAAIPLIAWILSGGLRRKLPAHRLPPATTIILIHRPAQPPPLPPIAIGDESSPSWVVVVVSFAALNAGGSGIKPSARAPVLNFPHRRIAAQPREDVR